MIIYICTLILIITLQPILKITFGSVKYKKIYVLLISIWLFLILVLRNDNVGKDLPVYIRTYPVFGISSWKNLNEIAQIYDMEVGYIALCKLLYIISINPRFLICVVSFFIIFAFSKEIKDNSSNPAFSYFLYITLGMYVRAFTAYRQQIATAAVLLAYHYIKEKKLIKFLIVILIASTIHKSVLVVVPMYFVVHMKINYKVYIGSFVGCLLCIAIGERLLSYVTYKERYAKMIARGSNGAIGDCIIFGAFIVLMILIWRNFKTYESRFFMHFAIFCLLISSLTFVLPIIGRVLYYFDAVMLCAIPNTISQIKRISTRCFVICGICSVTLLYYICIICRADTCAVVPYSFLWN